MTFLLLYHRSLILSTLRSYHIVVFVCIFLNTLQYFILLLQLLSYVIMTLFYCIIDLGYIFITLVCFSAYHIQIIIIDSLSDFIYKFLWLYFICLILCNSFILFIILEFIIHIWQAELTLQWFVSTSSSHFFL